MQQSIKGFLFILLCVCLEGLTPIFGKNAYQTGIGAETLLLLRFIIASTLLFSYCLIRKHSIAINQKQLYYIGILGFLACFQTLSFFISLQYILSSLAMVLILFLSHYCLSVISPY